MSKLRFANFLIAATLVLASCVAIERNNPDDPKSDNYVDKSELISSAGESSSSLGPPPTEEREHYGKMKPVFTDTRDGKKYVYVKMGTQTWMAENLNYAESGSRCYNDIESNCTTYGRLYNWATAQTVCPSGWSLPDNDDWKTLVRFVNPRCSEDSDYCALAGVKLKSSSGWYDSEEDGSSGNGTDNYGFTALPAGGGGDSFVLIGEVGFWWSDSGKDANDAYSFVLFNDEEFSSIGNFTKSFQLSVRCIKY